MFFILMYHNITQHGGKHTNTLEKFEHHLKFLKTHANFIKTGFNHCIHNSSLTVQITFDDAFYSFYHYVFPLLKKFSIPATLSVPTAFILESSTLSSDRRLNKHYYDIFNRNQPFLDAFCTWEELKELSQSPLISLAAHTHNHVDLTKLSPSQCLFELQHPLTLFEKHLNLKICDFVYPFGRYHSSLDNIVKDHYLRSYAIRNLINIFSNSQGPLYRINCDQLRSHDFPFSRKYPLYLKSFIKLGLDTFRHNF